MCFRQKISPESWARLTWRIWSPRGILCHHPSSSVLSQVMEWRESLSLFWTGKGTGVALGVRLNWVMFKETCSPGYPQVRTVGRWRHLSQSCLQSSPSSWGCRAATKNTHATYTCWMGATRARKGGLFQKGLQTYMGKPLGPGGMGRTTYSTSWTALRGLALSRLTPGSPGRVAGTAPAAARGGSAQRSDAGQGCRPWGFRHRMRTAWGGDGFWAGPPL